MATVATERDQAGGGKGGTGRIVRVIGPVVDVEFAPDELPAIHHALTVDRTLDEETTTITCEVAQDRKSTRLNSSHGSISYAVFCLKKNNHLLYRRCWYANGRPYGGAGQTKAM